MTDLQRCQQAATAPACPEKGAALLLIPHHLELIRATAQHSSAAGRDATLADWQAALAIALVSSPETIEEAANDRPH